MNAFATQVCLGWNCLCCLTFLDLLQMVEYTRGRMTGKRTASSLIKGSPQRILQKKQAVVPGNFKAPDLHDLHPTGNLFKDLEFCSIHG
jgi:hypothetical protein